MAVTAAILMMMPMTTTEAAQIHSTHDFEIPFNEIEKSFMEEEKKTFLISE